MPLAPSAEEKVLLDQEESLLRERAGCQQQLRIHERALAALDKRVTIVRKKRAELGRKREPKTPRREPERRNGVVNLDVPLLAGSSNETLSARTPPPNPPTPPPKSPSKTGKGPSIGLLPVASPNASNSMESQGGAIAESSANTGTAIVHNPADEPIETDTSSTCAATTRSEAGELAPMVDVTFLSPADPRNEEKKKELKDDEIDSKEITPVKNTWDSLHGKKPKTVKITAQVDPIRDPRLRVQPLQPQTDGGVLIPVIRVSRASIAMRQSYIARRNAQMKNIDRVRGVVYLSLSLHLKFDKLSLLTGSLTVETVDWPVLVSDMEFRDILQEYFDSRCLGDTDEPLVNTVDNAHDFDPTRNSGIEHVNDSNVFMGTSCENCEKCRLYSVISDLIHQFIEVLVVSQYSIFDLLECWGAVIGGRRNVCPAPYDRADLSNGSSQRDRTGTGVGSRDEGIRSTDVFGDGSEVEEDWVSMYVHVDHRQRVREIAEIIVECIEEHVPFHDPRLVRFSHFSRFSRLSRFSRFGATQDQDKRQHQPQGQTSIRARSVQFSTTA